MQRELLHIYGPFSIYSYGLAIAIGLALIVWLMQKHPKFSRLNLHHHFTSIVTVGILSGLAGGRLLYTLSEADGATTLVDFLTYWQGGFSVLGCILGVTLALPLWLRYCHVPVLPFLDLLAIYAPLLQGISRVGCFCAGCCYGLPSNLPWAVIYSDPHSSAPLGIYIHPTQLYSTGILLCIFALFYCVLQYRLVKPGQLFSLYLVCASLERFIVDFWRADRTFFDNPAYAILSINQWVALGIIAGAGIAFIYCTRRADTQRVGTQRAQKSNA
jgi:phosphatidylglycerol:prolipoprotein diacylglycerol transferase